jgi:small subunit ribosomal protein S6
MRPYEVMVIFDVALEESDIRQKIDRALEIVKSAGGTTGRIDHWGRRTFAYELKHRTEGYYVLIEATAEPQVLADVDRMLALEDSVLRHKVIRQPENAAGRTRPAARKPAAEPKAS